MLKVNERQLADTPSSLSQWADRAIGSIGIQVKTRLRGDKLHILCEGKKCPDRETAVARLVQALQATPFEALLPGERQTYQVFLYGRASGQKRPEWTQSIDPARLRDDEEKSYDTEVDEEPKESFLDREDELSSWRKQARGGHPDAISRYLSATLSSLGVGVKVAVARSEKTNRRLWVFCESAYSPDPSLLAAPVAQQLRELQLESFRDAAIVSQVTGEATPDWMLRVDLTPPEEMLKAWGRWGDAEAIARLLERALAGQQVQITAILKESTLHLSCTTAKAPERGDNSHSDTVPDKRLCSLAIAPLLLSLAPRGIQAATIYGHEAQASPPVWVDWLDLPAARNPDLAKPTVDLAREGDEAAIAFLLERLLNQDLDWRLATGGIRIQVRFKEDLLHVMADAPICPSQRLVASPSAQFARHLEISGITGVRVYGRRSGQKQPWWSYQLDFVNRAPQQPEATPEFPKSDDYADDLLVESEEPVSGSALIPADVKIAWKGKIWAWGRQLWENCYAMLTRSQLFVPSEERQIPSLSNKTSYQGVKLALVWGTAGILLTSSVDLVLGQILRFSVERKPERASSPIALVEPSLGIDEAEITGKDSNAKVSIDALKIPQISLQQSRAERKNAVFNASGFIKPGGAAAKKNTEIKQRSPYPSFNNTLLDAKLLLYQQRLAEKGSPDVLIVGSSRALRGIDPIALQKALAAQGYGEVQIFNFGVNGATAQVVDLMMRRILTPEQLPKLIIWADGVRAFNSNRLDTTFKSIAESDGYQKLIAGAFPRGNAFNDRDNNSLEPFTTKPMVPGTADNDAAKPQSIESWLNQFLTAVSASYPQRDRLQALVGMKLGDILSFDRAKAAKKPMRPLSSSQSSLDWNGFMPISTRFDADIYYQNHAKVPGEYDSDYKDFKLEGSQAIALESLIQFARSNRIGLVFVNLPLTGEYLDPLRSKHEQEFQMAMLRLSLSREFIFRDWSQLWPARNEFFSDPSHLNRYGAAAISIRLAQDPLIPWPKK